MADLSNVGWIEYDEKRWGYNDPNGNEDVFNRPCYDTIFPAFQLEHDRDGDHKNDLDDDLWKIEEGTYSGNGADDRDISLSNGSLDIKVLHILSGVVAYTFYKTEDMAGDTTRSTENIAFQADYIQSVGTGTFQVGADDATNKNGETYYYMAYGVE